MNARNQRAGTTPAAGWGKDTHKAFSAPRSNASSEGKSGPVVHVCAHPGCGAYAPYGENCFPRGDPKDQRWWCRKHVPDRFWDGKRKAEAGRANDGAGGSEPPPPRFKNKQGVLL